MGASDYTDPGDWLAWSLLVLGHTGQRLAMYCKVTSGLFSHPAAPLSNDGLSK